MKMKHTVLSAGVMFALGSTAFAQGARDDARVAGATQGLSYTYVELDGVWRNLEPFEDGPSNIVDDWDEGRGWAVRGSYGFASNWFVFGEYTQTDADAVLSAGTQLFPVGEDTKQISGGLGYNRALELRDTDFVARLAYTDFDFGDFEFGPGGPDDDLFDFLDDDTSGYFVDVGLRSQLRPKLEGGIGVRHLDIGEFDNSSLVGNLLYEFHENWGVNFEADLGTEYSTFMLGIRFSAADR